jgi:hypothetical protein
MAVHASQPESSDVAGAAVAAAGAAGVVGGAAGVVEVVAEDAGATATGGVVSWAVTSEAQSRAASPRRDPGSLARAAVAISTSGGVTRRAY